MIKDKRYLLAYKLILALLGLVALVTEIVVLVQRSNFNFGNFFSYFTVLSNLLAVITLLLSAEGLVNKKWFHHVDMWRGAATLYMATTGIVFAVLLAGFDRTILTAVPWANVMLHYLLSAAVFLDWVLDPPLNRISFRRAVIWLSWPLLYVVYTLIRGSMTEWYPYPFLNPATRGYAGIFTVSFGIAMVTGVLTSILILFSKRYKK